MFIALEGPDNSGKSTLVKMITEFLAKFYEAKTYQEPQGLYRELLTEHSSELQPKGKLLLYLASMVAHQPNYPEITLSGPTRKIYVGDRSLLSTLVYQILTGNTLSLPGFYQLVTELNLKWPSTIYILNLEYEEAAKRADSTDDPGGFEANVEFMRLVHDGYLKVEPIMQHLFPQARIVALDATEPVHKLFGTITRDILRGLSDRGLPTGDALTALTTLLDEAPA